MLQQPKLQRRKTTTMYVYLTSSFRWVSKSDGWKYRCLIWLTYFTSIIFIFHFIVTVRAGSRCGCMKKYYIILLKYKYEYLHRIQYASMHLTSLLMRRIFEHAVDTILIILARKDFKASDCFYWTKVKI